MFTSTILKMMKAVRCSKVLTLLIWAGVAWTGLAQEVKDAPDQFRQLTRHIDPFGRLAWYPENQRPTEAIDLCISRIEQLSSSELLRLKGFPPGEISEKQRRHLYAAVSMIVNTMEVADAITSQYHPKLAPGTLQKLARMRASTGAFTEINGVPLGKLKLNVSDCLALLKDLATGRDSA